MRLLILFVVSVHVAVSVAAAQTPQQEAERLRQIEARKQQADAAAETLRQRTEAEAAALSELKARLVDLADSIQMAERQAIVIEEELVRLAAAEVASTEELRTRQRSVSDVLAALQSLERSRPPALAVSPDDVTEAAVAALALSAITPELQAQVDALRQRIIELAQLRAEQSREKERLVRTEADLEERRRLLSSGLAQREAAQAEEEARLRRLERESALLAREATSLRDLIAELQARSVVPSLAIDAVTVGGPEVYSSLPDRFSLARTVLPWPAAGRIISPFGARTSTGGRAEDLTMRTRPGAVVTAPFSGTISWAEPFGRLGNVLIIDVGESYSLVLIGLGRLDVRRGEQVRAGEPLGQMARGNPGRLRFQVRRGDVPLDPARWLRAAGG